jgi:hypothetical protein
VSLLAKRIRRAAADGLQKLGTPANERVYTNRYRPLPTEDAAGALALPAIVVYTATETIEVSVDAPKEYRRRMEMTIEIVVARLEEKYSDADDRLDEIADQVEQWVFHNPTFGLGLEDGIVFGDHPSSLIRDENAPVDEGEYNLAAKRLTFEVTYYQGAPEHSDEGGIESLPTAKTFVPGWDLGPEPDGVLEAVDEIHVGAPE